MHQSLKKCKFIFRVCTESCILEKVLKFAQQFSRPGKSLGNGDKEKSVFLLFLGPLLVTYFDNLESGKKTAVLEKKSWFLDPKTSLRTLILKVMFWLLSPLSMLFKAPSYGWTGVCSINQVKMSYSNVAANKLYNTGMRSVLEINN